MGDLNASRFEPLTESELSAARSGVGSFKDDGECVMPVPPDAPAPPDAHSKWGAPSARWFYPDASGALLFEVWRLDPHGERKQFLPLSLWRKNGRLTWRWKAIPEPRSLYGLDRLARRPDASVVICEGEKAADAAGPIFPKSVCITSPGGSQAASKADWVPLVGRRVLIWPDADEPGAKYANTVAAILHALGCEVSIIDAVALAGMSPDGGKREPVKGWDAADAVAEWQDIVALRKAVHGLAKPFEPGMSSPHGPATPNARDHGNDLSDTAFDAAIKEIAAMPLASYARGRRDEARRLGIGVSALDKIVAAARPRGEAEPGQGRPLELATPEPWPEPVNGAALVAELTTAIRRYVVLSASDALTVALWVLHTYCFDVFSCTPRLAITAPEKRCGKTTLLDVIALIVSKALPTANISAAALFRTVELARPTLLIDEADAFLGENEELRGILNSGHRAGGQVIRTVGDDFEPRAFSTHCPVAIAQIGKLPDTLADRSIHISMKRRAPGETVARFCYGRTPDLSEVAMEAARWGADNADAIRACDPNIPDAIFNRAADNWEPLLAVAEVAGGDIPERARQVALAACGVEEEPSHGAMLLAAIRSVFEERDCTRITSADLIAALVNMADRPWGECNHGKALTQNQLARRLKNFGVRPKVLRIGADQASGYELKSFTDAFNRYLPPSQTLPPYQTNEINGLDENQTLPENFHGKVEKSRKYSNFNDGKDGKVANPPTGGMRDVKDGNRETEAKDRNDRVIACGMALANWTRRFGVPTTANSELIRGSYQLGPTSLDEERIIFGFTSDAAREAELGDDLHQCSSAAALGVPDLIPFGVQP